MFLISRPVNVFIAMLSIFLAAIISGPLLSAKIILACLTGAFVTIASNAINDFYDVEIDAINRPARPLPGGLLSKNMAFVFSLFCYFLALLTSAFINASAFFICLFVSGLLYLYSAKLKKTVLLGNLAVSFSTAMAFLFGGIAVGHVRHAFIPALFAFMMHLGREIIKDMEDVEGDRRFNANTLPVKYGLLPAKSLATGILICLAALTFVPYALNLYGGWYLILVILGVNSVLAYTIITVWLRSNRENFRVLSALLKADMLIGLLAIYAGRW